MGDIDNRIGPTGSSRYVRGHCALHVEHNDLQTAEVKPMDGYQNDLVTHCVNQLDFRTNQTLLVEAVFHLFLTNGSFPILSKELGARLNRSLETILRTLAAPGLKRHTAV